VPFPPLSCTVRGCGLPLDRRETVWRCPAGHSFDIARRGYVNLLQPQDRKAPLAGDSTEAVAARAALVAAGVNRALSEEVRRLLEGFDLPEEAVVADLGCGTGDILRQLTATLAVTGVGIDLSTAAIEYAAREDSRLTWVVANADRRLPLLDHSVDVVLSLHARRQPEECARVLKPAGALVVAVPAPDDQIELRQRVQGAGLERDRAAPLMTEHASLFTLRARTTVRDHVQLGRAGVLALLRATYRGGRRSNAERVQALESLEVTLASDVCVFTPDA
jgi:23S rRNA (guanine745-N1)-methyltransferase